MPNDIPDWTNAVTVQGGNVNVGTGNVTITGGQGGVNVSTDSPPKLLGNITIGAGGTFASGAFNLDTNATGIIVVPVNTNNPPVSGNITRMDINGGVSGFNYASVKPVGGNAPPLLAAIPGAADNAVSVTITVGTGAVAAGTVANVYEVFNTGVQQVYTTTLQPLDVEIANSRGIPPGALDINGLPMPIKVATVDVSGASGATSQIIAGVANATVTIYGWHLNVGPDLSGGVSPATNSYYWARLRDTNGFNVFASVLAWIMSASGLASVDDALPIPWGFPLPTVGTGVQLLSTTSGAQHVSVHGAVYYTQG